MCGSATAMRASAPSTPLTSPNGRQREVATVRSGLSVPAEQQARADHRRMHADEAVLRSSTGSRASPVIEGTGHAG